MPMRIDDPSRYWVIVDKKPKLVQCDLKSGKLAPLGETAEYPVKSCKIAKAAGADKSGTRIQYSCPRSRQIDLTC